MLYKPAQDRLWDSWIVPHNGKFYLFYIRVSPSGTRWDGISLAISDDLLHWQEHGPVFEKHPDAVWLGTGMVQKIDGKFIMNFSEERPAGKQYIGFATSPDLLEWSRLDDIQLCPDPRYYLDDPMDSCEELPRWDSLGIVDALQSSNPPYTAFLTAHASERRLKGKSGVLGMLTSEDGIHWNSLPPATSTELFPNYEVPEHLTFNGRHYVMFSTVTLHGIRYDARSIDKSGGTYYVVSEQLQGPYRLPPGDPMLLGIRNHINVVMAYVGRIIKDDSGYLFYHIWGDHSSNGRIGIPKRIVEKKPWELELRYWEGCESLKGALLANPLNMNRLSSLRQVGHLPSVLWSAQDEVLSFVNQGSADAVSWELEQAGVTSTDDYLDLRDGRIIECSLRVDEGLGAGIWIGEQKLILFLHLQGGRVELGTLQSGWMAPQMMNVLTYKDWSFSYGESIRLRLFVRDGCVEVFVNDSHAMCYRLTDAILPGPIGFYSEDSSGCFEDVKIWQMN